MLTKCPSCDRQIPVDAQRCPHCKKKLKPQIADDTPRETPWIACWEMLRGKRPVSCAGIAIATSFFVFSLVCVLCVLVWGLSSDGEIKLPSRPREALRTPRSTSTAQPTAAPTTTPFPSAPSYEEITENMQLMTEAQWNRYRKDIEGTQVISWTGWVADVTEKTFSGYELLIDMDPPESTLSTFDVTFDLPKDEEALAIAKGSPIVFSGRIDSISDPSQASLVISLKDAEWTIESDESTPPTQEGADEPTPAIDEETPAVTSEPTSTPEDAVTITDEPIPLCECSKDLYDCEDFPSDQLAQECYLHCLDEGYEDIHDLDRDGDGWACEWEE